jgi:endonuclease G
MSFNLEIARQAAGRWRQHREENVRNLEKINSGRIVEIESPSRIKARLDRLAMNATREPSRSAEVIAATDAQAITSRTDSSLLSRIGLERVIGKADFLNVNFLEQALAVSRFVCRLNLKISKTRNVGFGTGFMVSPRLMLTNNHVLSGPEFAVHSEAEFDFQYDRFGRWLPVVNYSLDPGTFFMTDENLDFTLVAVSQRSISRDVDLLSYGWNRLIGEEGKALIGDSLNIIQHPKGDAKQISLRANRLINLLDDFAHYETDTEPGSSGSPVYNDQWEVVALHHSGVPKTENGDLIAVDGSIWRDGDDVDSLDWVANEGIRISKIVRFIRAQNLSSEQANLRRELLELEPPNPITAAIRAEEEARKRSNDVRVVSPLHGGLAESAALSFTVPLQVSIAVGAIVPSVGETTINDSQRAPATTPSTPVKPDSPTTEPAPILRDAPGLREALAEFKEALTRPYYDEAADAAVCAAYYQGIDPGNFDRAEMYRALNELVEATHKTRISYRPATHVYPWVDLHRVGTGLKLRSIYSGKEFEATDFIEADFRVEAERNRLREVLLRESSFNAMEKERQISLLEASLPFNCEHVVPQSWFSKNEPMRGDLHHLFACEVGCNSFRSNIPYFDFDETDEAIRDECGRREENRFEPGAGKGPVARATLYFLLRYPSHINPTEKEYKAERIETLLNWHRQDPVGRYELHRNAAIQEKQGNRNPLIDFPDWAELIDFTLGLA